MEFKVHFWETNAIFFPLNISVQVIKINFSKKKKEIFNTK